MYPVIYDAITIKSINIVKPIIVDIGANGKYSIKYISFIRRKAYTIPICTGILSSNGVIPKNKPSKISIFFMPSGDNPTERNIANSCRLLLIFPDTVASTFDNPIIANKPVIKPTIKFMVFIPLASCFSLSKTSSIL